MTVATPRKVPTRKLEALIDACRLLIACEQAIRVPDHLQAGPEMQRAFAEAWLDMKQAFEELEERRDN